MDTLEEAKDIMEKVGCTKAFAVYSLELSKIAEVRSFNEKGEYLELEKDIDKLTPIIKRKLEIDPEKPIECPLNTSMNKYLEFSLKDRTVTPYNICSEESKRIEDKNNRLLRKYNWSIKKSKSK
jgi:hypothetical protein